MNFKQKLAYMAIGCVFTLVGYLLATLGAGGFNPQNATAQDNMKQVIDEIITRKLKVVNSEGKTIAILGEDENDNGTLFIFNKASGSRVGCDFDKNGDGRLFIGNKSGKPVVGLSAFEGYGTLIIGNKSGKIVAGLGVEDDAGILSIANKNEIEVATLKGYLGSGSLSLSNKEGMTRAVLAASPSSYLPSIYRQREREGEDGVTLSYGYEDSGFLSISNKNGHEVATLGATSDGGILSIYNKNSKVSARVGIDTHGWGGFQYFKGKWRTH